MAVSRMVRVETELGSAIVFANDGKTLRFRMTPHDTQSVAIVRGVKYNIDRQYNLNDSGEWQASEHRGIWKTGTYGSDGNPTPTARMKLDTAVQQFIDDWVKTSEGQQLLADTELQDRREKVASLRKKETEILSSLEAIRQEITQAEDYLSEIEPDRGIS